ncbi:MAG: histidinol-phosphate transaminase [Spirochaetaceae bacterium]|nr:MAG: histidinol-phosphate transaminase [Spirochaetaceae bacterium]
MTFRPVLSQLKPYEPGKPVAGGIKLSSNENPLGSSPLALEAMRGALADVSRYPESSLLTLRSAIAAHAGVEAEMVVVGNGSDEIMAMIAGALIEPGTNAVTGANTFSQYAFVTRIFGGEIRTAPMPDGRFVLDDMRGLIDSQTRIVWLCSPNNPTGTLITDDELSGFIAALPPSVLIVIDEAYGEYVRSPHYPDTIALVRSHPNLIRLRTFSKIYGLAALRIGYGIAQARAISEIGKLRQPFNVGTVSQAAAIAALDDHSFVDRSLETNEAQLARITQWLEQRGIRFYPSDANFVCACVPGRARAVVEETLARGVSLRWLGSFGMPDWIRISVGTAPEIDELVRVLALVLDDRGDS